MGLNLNGATRMATVALGTVLALTLAAPAYAAAPGETRAEPPSDPVTIEPVTTNGSGCPDSEATVTVARDNTGFTARHDGFFAHAGRGAGPIDFRKNCQVNLKFNIPDGYTYAITRGERGGFLFLPDGASSVQRTSYYFAGSPQTTNKEHQFNGPYNDVWRTVDEFAESELIWAPCNATRNLNINTQIRVNLGGADPNASVGFMLLGRSRGAVAHYGLAWQRCAA